MPISEKQLIANRQNAKKSTGPRTPEGKAKASNNSTTHGLNAGATVIKSPHLNECQSEYDEFFEALTDELAPEGILQKQLVRKITNCLWRQRRAMNAETAHLNRQLTEQADILETFPPNKSTNPTNEAIACSIPTGAFCMALLRYELRLDTQLDRAYKLLRILQSPPEEKELY